MPESIPAMHYTFGWHSKLRKADDFSSVFRLKRLTRRKHLDIYYRKNSLGYARLGMIVAKKTLPRAVDRNKTRRILRESFRQQQNFLGDLDIVIRLKLPGFPCDYRSDWEAFLTNLVAGTDRQPHNRNRE